MEDDYELIISVLLDVCDVYHEDERLAAALKAFRRYSARTDALAVEVGRMTAERDDANIEVASGNTLLAELTAEIARLKHSEAEAWAEVADRDDSAEIDRDAQARLEADNAALRAQLAAAGEWRPVSEAPTGDAPIHVIIPGGYNNRDRYEESHYFTDKWGSAVDALQWRPAKTQE